ncbi:MAG TPA: helix-turn-helix domain-containing protein, partial [Symbiobacteriaceae bacterium]|nr:helix-turn-helix domain-containing protein [Symbiobacteriaceae bacterium]
FLRRHRSRLGSRVARVSPEVEQFFLAYTWPGNVRELEHAVEAALHVVQGDTLSLGDLPAHLQRAAAALGVAAAPTAAPARQDSLSVDPRELRTSLARAEREALLGALQQTGWNLSQVSRILGIPRQTLQYRLKIHGLTRPRTGR